MDRALRRETAEYPSVGGEMQILGDQVYCPAVLAACAGLSTAHRTVG